MTDELQDDVAVEEQTTEIDTTDSELATEKEAESAPVEQTDEEKEAAQAAIQKVINQKHFKQKEAERKQAAETQRADVAERELKELRQAQVPETIPDVPDQYDADFTEKWQARDLAIKRQAEQDYYNQNIQQQQYRDQQEQQRKQQEELQETAKTYTEKAIKDGMTAQQLQTAGMTVRDYGIAETLSEEILKDDDGGLIVQYLAGNLKELDTLASMSDLQAGKYIERNIRAKAQELRGKKSNTPPPPKDVNGGGVDKDAGRYPHSKGAVFE